MAAMSMWKPTPAAVSEAPTCNSRIYFSILAEAVVAQMARPLYSVASSEIKLHSCGSAWARRTRYRYWRTQVDGLTQRISRSQACRRLGPSP